MNARKTVAILISAVMLILSAAALSACGVNNKMKCSLSFKLDAEGHYTSVKSGGTELAAPAGGGFSVYDFDSETEYPVEADTVSEKGNTVTVTGGSTEGRFEFIGTLKSENGAIFVSGTVTDKSGADRRLTVRHSLPFFAENAKWATGLDSANDAGSGLSVNHITFSKGIKQAKYPLAAVFSDTAGIAAATDFSSPVIYDFIYDGDRHLLTAEFYMGISAATKNPSQGSFSCIYYDYDGANGFRGATEMLYALIPESFTGGSENHGNWLFQQLKYGETDATEDFLFGYNETPGFASDKENGVTSFVYVAPAELWLSWQDYTGTGTPTAADLESRLEQMLALPESQTDMYAPVSSASTAKAIIASSYLKKNGLRWTAGWNSTYSRIMCFVANGDSDIPDGCYAVNRAVFEAKVKSAEADGYSVGGLYIDNANFNHGTYDYNKDNFKYSDYPLLWDSTGTLALPLGYSSWDFIERFTSEEKAAGRISLGNIAFPDKNATPFAHFFDVPGGEIGNSWGQTEDDFVLRRINAGKKPWALLLTQNFEDVFEGVSDKTAADLAARETLMKNCLYWGVMLNAATLGADSAAFELVRPMYVKYGWATKNLSEAGWEPVTRASGTSDKITCERYGGGNGSAVRFSVRASDGAPSDGGITVDTAALGFKNQSELVAFDEVRNIRLPITAGGDGKAIVTTSLAAGDCISVVIGTEKQIMSALGNEMNALSARLEKSASEAADIAGKRLDSPDAAIALTGSIKNKINEFSSAVKNLSAADAASAMSEIYTLSAEYTEKYSTGKIQTKTLAAELTDVAARYRDKLAALSE